MRGWVLLALCGCNPVFGIETTGLIDAPPDSPPIDAPTPFTCPPAGSVPVFGTSLTMVPDTRECISYVTNAAGDSAALCGSYWAASFMSGTGEQPLAASVLDPATPNTMENVRLAPEGTDVYVTHWDANWAYATTHYQAKDGIWKQQGTAFIPNRSDNYSSMSTPTRGTPRRAVIQALDAGFAPELRELEETSDGWIDVRGQPLSELGVTAVWQPSLSADGLRLVFIDTGYVGQTTGPSPPTMESRMQPVLYAERPDLGSKFGPAMLLETVPGLVQWPYMTEDCGRIYFSALNTVWYLEQPR